MSSEADQVLIRIDFTMTDEDGTVFRDALTMPLSEYESLTTEEREAKKLERFNSWKQLLTQRATAPPPDPIDIIATIDIDIGQLQAEREAQVKTVAEQQQIEEEVVEQQVDAKIVEKQAATQSPSGGA